MQPIYTKEQLQTYLERLQRQTEVLKISTLFEPTEIEVLVERYEQLERMATNKLARLNGLEEKKEAVKLHRIVIYDNPGLRNIYIKGLIDKKECLQFNDVYFFSTNKTRIKPNTEAVVIMACDDLDINEVCKLLMADTLELEPGRRIHTLPFIVCCRIPKSKLPAELLNRCEIIEIA